MATLRSKKVQSSLENIKDNVRDFYEYFRPNYDRYNEFSNFVFRTSLSQDDIALYHAVGKPQIEFNILEAYISRLRGEFSQQEPTLDIMPAYDAESIDPELLKILEDHVRAIIFDSNTDNMMFDVITDTLAGGFSIMKVWTEYAHEESFDQVIRIGRVYDPTLCGFDKLARQSHKGDGRYSFELFPMEREEFEDKYGTKYTQSMKFSKNIESFGWSYSNGLQDIILIGDYYKKELRTKKLVKLITGQVMEEKAYEQFIANWNMNPAIAAQAPIAVQSKTAEVVTVCRTKIIENDVLEYEETDFKYLPHVFVDGNSKMIRTNLTDAATQLCRPYVYHAKGIQKLKNFSGVTLANALENIVQSPIMIPDEAIPEQYMDNWLNIQKASILPYKAYRDTNGQIPLPPPSQAPQAEIPPAIAATFTLSDEVTQAILGSYDASLGINNNQLSGKAIREGASNSNVAARPYLVNYMKALNQVGKIVLDLIPKYYVFPRTIRSQGVDGNSGYAKINYPGTPQMNYNPDMLDIRIEAGVAFEVQQKEALASMISIMQVNPTFAQFMAGQKGLESLLDNLNIRGIDALKQAVAQFIQEQKAQQQQMMQFSPQVIKAQELQVKARKNQSDAQIDAARVSVEKQDSDTDRILALAQIGQMSDQGDLARDKLQAEQARTAVEAATKAVDMKHGHIMDLLSLHHENQHKQADRDLQESMSRKPNNEQ